jgi:hypothetical protein
MKPFLNNGLLIPGESETLSALQQRPRSSTLVDGAAELLWGWHTYDTEHTSRASAAQNLARVKAVQRGGWSYEAF